QGLLPSPWQLQQGWLVLEDRRRGHHRPPRTKDHDAGLRVVDRTWPMCDWNLAKDWPNDPCTKPEDRPCRNAVSRSMGSGRDGHKVCEACYRRSKRLQRFKKNNRSVKPATDVQSACSA